MPNFNNSTNGLSRRSLLQIAGACTTAMILPTSAFGQSANQVTYAFASGGPEIMWSPHFVASAQGYYEEEGIKVDRVFSGGGPASIAALVSGSCLTAFCPPGEMLVAAARGQKYKILVAQSNYVPLTLILSGAYAAEKNVPVNGSRDEKIASLRSLTGIKIGVTAPNSMTDKFARRSLSQANLNPDVDAQVVPLGSVQNAVAALSRGTVDAVVASAPATSIAIAEFGAVPFLRLSNEEVDGFKTLAGHLVQARAADIEERPELFEALVRAEVRGFRHIIEKPDDASEILYTTQFSRLDRKVWDAAWAENIPLFRSPYVTTESVAAWINLGLVPGATDPAKVNLEELVDMSYVDKAIAAIGWSVPK